MITVLCVIDTLGPGGAETVFLNTCVNLDRDRFRCVCIVGGEGWLAAELRAHGLTPLIIPSKGSINVSYLRALLRISRAEKVDVIAAHLYGSSVYCSMAGLLLRRPVISVLHGQTDISEGGRLAWLKKLAVRLGTTRLVFVSNRLKEALLPLLGVAERNCAIIPNGVDLRRFAPAPLRPLRTELALAPDTVLVGALGNVRKPKAYDVFLRTARLLKDRSPNYRFAIAGDASGDLFTELLALRRDLGLDEAVTFLGLRSDVVEFLRSIDVYVLSSTTEGFSIACIEAMAAGAPVVSTRCGGPEEILEHEDTGLLVPVQDPVALAAAVHRIVENRPFADSLRERALQRVAERYALGAMVRSYEGLFEDLAGR